MKHEILKVNEKEVNWDKWSKSNEIKHKRKKLLRISISTNYIVTFMKYRRVKPTGQSIITLQTRRSFILLKDMGN